MTNFQKSLLLLGASIGAGVVGLRTWTRYPVLGFFGGFMAVGVVAYAAGFRAWTPAAPPPDTSMGGSGP